MEVFAPVYTSDYSYQKFLDCNLDQDSSQAQPYMVRIQPKVEVSSVFEVQSSLGRLEV